MSMMQGFSSQLIPNEVGTDIAAPARTDIPDLSLLCLLWWLIALDQNFTNQNAMNYVNVSVPSDIAISSFILPDNYVLDRNFYSTVSLPQNIVSSIDVSACCMW